MNHKLNIVDLMGLWDPFAAMVQETSLCWALGAWFGVTAVETEKVAEKNVFM